MTSHLVDEVWEELTSNTSPEDDEVAPCTFISFGSNVDSERVALKIRSNVSEDMSEDILSSVHTSLKIQISQ